ncbi:aspartyl/asparaginyl beta-hydroxylase domain-containing protein [Gracilimonas mengyeensis]|uniref:Aspartyl/Asparaginyl beta-hydroxylase n=1 Tax=Gracilimonas mengyeensis TaxID=1302730 RepID=A0A521CLH3_9BACT|nr:aspartyl/asparaginyl beta-hydroxylase domain-containing protein [Gracilimonas mengyeensis]SMO60215.1 Aspartyl/Asparaginyl beta-hydroxylase [Gracilimonas mengyeensis]
MKNIHKLSLHFDSKSLLHDFQNLLPDWEMHFNTQYYSGNWSGIPLRAAVDKNHTLSAGDESNTVFEDTEYLDKAPYLQEVLSHFKTPKQSVRLLRLTPGSEIKEHQDFGLGYFDGAVRLHVPILTNPKVEFCVEGENIPMTVGECWFANFNAPHSVANHGDTDRVHLVVDLEVNEWLQQLFEKEGIIDTEETPEERHNEEEQRQIIASLKEMGTDTSLKLAREMEEKISGA